MAHLQPVPLTELCGHFVTTQHKRGHRDDANQLEVKVVVCGGEPQRQQEQPHLDEPSAVDAEDDRGWLRVRPCAGSRMRLHLAHALQQEYLAVGWKVGSVDQTGENLRKVWAGSATAQAFIRVRMMKGTKGRKIFPRYHRGIKGGNRHVLCILMKAYLKYK